MRIILSLYCLSLLLIIPNKGDACCAAGKPGAYVQIADQEILVVWDEVNKREHFIRQAKFETGLKNYGFLVPTPSQPELAEAEAAVFERLKDVTKPVVKTNYNFHYGFFSERHALNQKGRTDAKKSAVDVLERKKLAGYEAVVLRADDPKALGDWLKENGFEFRDEIIDWVRPYIEAQWLVTAFRFINSTPKLMQKPTKAIRMSFDTDRPLFPYRVPTDNIGKSRNLLRVHFVGPKRVVGTLGKDKKEWAGELKYAGSRGDIKELLSGTGPAANVSGTWLSSFDDKTWPSGVEDLYFESSPNQESFVTIHVVEKNVVIIYEFVIGLFLIIASIIGFAIYRRRKSSLVED